MNRRRFLQAAACAALAVSVPLPAEAGKALVFDEVLALLKKASPTGYHIIKDYEALPTKFVIGGSEITISKVKPAEWLKHFQPVQVVLSCNTMVHETCHGYARRKAYAMGARALAVVPSLDKTILVPPTPTFPSREIAQELLPELKNCYRYQGYIDTEQKNHVTQVEGVYGLLNEFNAYLSGNRCALDLIRYLARNPERDGNAWLTHISGLTGTVTAHQEFRGFILGYLLHASRHHKTIYRQIVANQKFKDAYKHLSSAYNTLYREWKTSLPTIIRALNNRGIALKIQDDSVLFGNTGRGLAEADYTKLAKAIDTDPSLKKQEAVLLA